jgi:hypothetical protein
VPSYGLMSRKDHVRARWTGWFDCLERLGPDCGLSPRQLSGLYAVASICYHGNATSLIADGSYDGLCRWLHANFELCVRAGADLLDKELLACSSGIDLGSFVKPYHDIAGTILAHSCQCWVCRERAAEAA